MELKSRIFKKGSKTYYNTARFFPKDIRDDVFTLYAWVRTADNLVDSIPQQINAFKEFCKQTKTSWEGEPVDNEIIDDFVELAKRKSFQKEWINAFLKAMASDVQHKPVQTIDEAITYMHGSAEVIGLMMAAIMDLPEEAYESAKMLGRSMQYINFIRDISEDLKLGRQYLPVESMKTYGLSSLERTDIDKVQFGAFITEQLKLYEEWRTLGKIGFKHIPKKYLKPIRVADKMYAYTAKKIKKNPLIVYDHKVKPSKWRIIRTIYFG